MHLRINGTGSVKETHGCCRHLLRLLAGKGPAGCRATCAAVIAYLTISPMSLIRAIPSASLGCLYNIPWSDGVGDRLAAPDEQLGKRVAHPHQTRVRCGAVKDDVEPVFVAEIASLGPFIITQFNAAGAGPSLDFYGASFPFGTEEKADQSPANRLARRAAPVRAAKHPAPQRQSASHNR